MGFFFFSETFSSLGDFTSTLEMHLKEKKRFSVSDEEYPRGCDGHAGSENDWKEESAALYQDLLIQVNNNWGFQFPFMTILKESTSTRKDPADYYT